MLTKMMLDFKKRLTAHLEIRDIRIALHSQLEQAEKTLDIMEKYNKFLANPRNSQSKALYISISRESGLPFNQIYPSLLSGMKSSVTRLQGLITLYDGVNYNVLITSSVHTINASALHLAAIIDFYEQMSRSLVLTVSELESLTFKQMAVPRELDNYIRRNLSNLRLRSLASIMDYNQRVKQLDVVKAIKEMDDVEVTEETLKAAKAMGGSAKIDPAGFNYLNVINPLFWTYVGFKVYSEFQLMRLDLQREELAYLEIRYQELAQLKANGHSDVGTDRTLTKIKDRIDVMRYDIKELEEKLG